MNKILKYSLLVIFVITVVGCTRSVEISNTSIEISQSTKFNEDTISDAINKLQSEFDLKGATLLRVKYDEVKSNNAIKDYIMYGNGMESKAEAENTIVLFTDFYVDDSGSNPVLESDFTYTNYSWLLTRDDSDSDWEIEEGGF